MQLKWSDEIETNHLKSSLFIVIFILIDAYIYAK